MKKIDLAEKVARKVDNPPITMIVDEGRINHSSYLRAWVFLELDKPLIRVVPITTKESRRYLAQYEKLLTICFVCGIMGRRMTECGDGVHDLSKCHWGDWLLDNFGLGAKCGNGARGGMSNRGRGRGRGMSRSDAEEEDMEIFEDETPHANLVLHPGSSTGLLESPKKIQEKKRQRKEGLEKVQ
jgi:hypothetical protein